MTTQTNTTNDSMKISEWRALEKGTLRGYFDLQLPSGLCLRGCSYHQKDNGGRWIGLPSREYKKADGSSAWTRIVDFDSRQVESRFQHQALEALDDFIRRLAEKKGKPDEIDPEWGF